MRSGTYIQALGRQSFEPSLPVPSEDGIQPSAASHDRQRELINAQDDVLSTVGMCLLESKQSLVQSEDLMAENEMGLTVGVVDLTVTYLVGWPLIGIRNRLQTYRMHEGSRYRDVLRAAWSRYTWGELFSGMPAHLLYQALNIARDPAQGMFMNWLQAKPCFIDPTTGEPRNGLWLHAVDKCLSFASWFVIYPLWYHANLQALHLIPLSPVLPTFRSMLAFSSSSPISRPHVPGPLFSLATANSLLVQAATSYFIQSFVTQSISVVLQYWLYHKILNILPAPTNEEPMSTIIDVEPWEAVAARVENNLATTNARGAVTRTHNSFNPETSDLAAPPADGHPLEVEPETGEMQEPPLVEPMAPPSPAQPERSPSRPPPPRRASSLAHHHHHHHHHHSNNNNNNNENNDNNNNDGSHRRQNRNRSEYRSTTLSSHPVDIAASNAADCIINALFVVGESIILRALARRVLMERGMEELVYAPLEFVGTGQGLVAKALVVGEWGLMWVLFEGTWAVSTWVGVRWFGYASTV